MNDYRFGSFIMKIREKTGMTQSQLAASVGVTNKAVSKWVTGASKPTTDTLRRLSALWNVPIEEMLILKKDKKWISPKLLLREDPVPANLLL